MGGGRANATRRDEFRGLVRFIRLRLSPCPPLLTLSIYLTRYLTAAPVSTGVAQKFVNELAQRQLDHSDGPILDPRFWPIPPSPSSCSTNSIKTSPPSVLP